MIPDDHQPVAHVGKGRLGEDVPFPELHLEYPGWVRRKVDWTRLYPGERDRMRVALLAASQNVEQKTGGPFGAAVFESQTGRLISVGLDLPADGGKPFRHAELMALAMASARLGIDRFEGPDVPLLELHASVEPCLMCAGAILLSGLQLLFCASTADDAEVVGRIAINGINHLEAVGIHVRRELLRDEARDVMRLYRSKRGPGS